MYMYICAYLDLLRPETVSGVRDRGRLLSYGWKDLTQSFVVSPTIDDGRKLIVFGHFFFKQIFHYTVVSRESRWVIHTSLWKDYSP